ncbi:MAG: aminoglycoside phosphotransferase family protein [Acidobacteria bacterium]|nr:aminoglycoside phosphotransferase family protein [Acidobacteriota bacterium]
MPRDRELPALREALDPEAMRERFLSLDLGIPEAREVAIAYARYKPGLSCVIQYHVRSSDGERILLGRVCAEADFDSLAAKAIATLRPAPGAGSIVHLLPDLRVVLTAFPHDRAVKGMRQVLEPDKLKRILHRVVARYDPARRWVSGSHSRIDLVTYKPERRCLVRCDLGVRDRASGEIQRETIYARIYSDATGRRVFDLLKSLQTGCAFGQDGAPVPAPLGYDPDHRILFFDPVPGRPIAGRCKGEELADAVEKAGEFLAHLHAAAVEVPRLHHPATLLSEARQTTDRLAASGVEEAGDLLEAIRRLRQSQPPSAAGLACLHGDFHPGQILVQGSSLHCIDFDETGMGEAAFDVGYFIAHLRRLVRLRLLDEETESLAAGRFLAGYGRRGALPSPEACGWHRDLTLLRMALNSLKHLEAGWPETIRFYMGGQG